MGLLQTWGLHENTDCWSLENDLVIRRLTRGSGDHRRWRRKGSSWILKLCLALGGLLSGSWDRDWARRRCRNPEILQSDPEIVVGTRRFLWLLFDPEAFEAMLEPGGLDPEIVVWNPEEPKGSSLDPEIFDWNPEAIGEPGGTVLPVPVWISHSAARKLATIEFLCCILLLQEVTNMLKGCWCGCCDPSARLTLLSTSGEAGYRLLPVLFTLVLWGPRCALGCTGVLGSFDSILRLVHTHSCFMSHTRFDSLWACHCGRATFVRVGHRRSLENLSSSYAPLRSGFLPLIPGPCPQVRVPASGSRIPAPDLGPASGHGSLSPSLGPSSVVQANRKGYISPREDLLLREVYDRLIPAITTIQMTSYALCSTPTTPHTGPGHDLQFTDRDTPCSSKHIEAPCSLQHIDYSTICSAMHPLEQMVPITYGATC
ncbi:hypothetical protein F2Q68_00040138 [Brassica cretica]|uniref:Uncharacterized protein n=1 Tax=Brassica cretica TaxID=69181 RepID=A0A8S9MD87_BRACR|nr:hypothetical protein F2Q68_00040138 [Brassica cretica]